MPKGAREQIAEEALAALRHRCRGGSWQGLARELAWRAVTGGPRDARRSTLRRARRRCSLLKIDQALWTVEHRAIDSYQEFLDEHQGDAEGARIAAQLDAAEEAERLIVSAYDRRLTRSARATTTTRRCTPIPPPTQLRLRVGDSRLRVGRSGTVLREVIPPLERVP